MPILGSIIIASLFVSALSFVGIIVLAKRRIESERLTSSLVSFAAGVMLATALLELLPEAIEEAGKAVVGPLFLGILLFFFFERFLLWFHHHHEPHGAKPTTLLVLVGDGLHNIIDGVAIAAAFMAGPDVGLAATLAISAHEIPQEIADLSLLIHGGMKKSSAMVYNFLSGLTALIGAVGGYFYLQQLKNQLPILLAFTVGMFLYIACSDLIPDMHKDFAKQRRWQQTVPFLIGIALMWTLTMLIHE